MKIKKKLSEFVGSFGTRYAVTPEYTYLFDLNRAVRIPNNHPLAVNIADDERMTEIDLPSIIPEMMDKLNNYHALFHKVELPAVEELKTQLRELVGRKRDRVIYKALEGEDCPAVNVRYLIAAMEAIDAREMWVRSLTSPIYLFEEDDLASGFTVLLLPVNVRPDEKGMWVSPI